VLQLVDVLNNGYWHARSTAFLGNPVIKFIEWLRIVPDLIFGVIGVVPIAIAALITYLTLRKQPATA
jgi:nitric oxide reductase subunit B